MTYSPPPGQTTVTALSSGSPYTVAATDQTIVVTTGASGFTINLLASIGGGKKLTIIKADSGAGAITVSPNGSDKIEGAGSKTMSSQYGKLLLADNVLGVWSDLGTGSV